MKRFPVLSDRNATESRWREKQSLSAHSRYTQKQELRRRLPLNVQTLISLFNIDLILRQPLSVWPKKWLLTIQTYKDYEILDPGERDALSPKVLTPTFREDPICPIWVMSSLWTNPWSQRNRVVPLVRLSPMDHSLCLGDEQDWWHWNSNKWFLYHVRGVGWSKAILPPHVRVWNSL